SVLARGTFAARDFPWQGSIHGYPDGRVDVRVRGATASEFCRNRLGQCILHPPQASGDKAIVEHVDGSIEESAFPAAISPAQPFTQMRALTHQLHPGLRSTIRMQGETFESEDHRNWGDASFKHYCTPIRLPFPVQVHPGQTIEQSVTLTIDGDLTASDDPVHEQDEVLISIHGDDVGGERVALPEIGIQLDGDGHRLTTREQDLLRALRLTHVRVDLGPQDTPDVLRAYLQQADAIGASVVVALNGADSDAFADFRHDPRIRRWLVFDPASKVTDPAAVDRVAKALGPQVGGGTNLYFTELNRGRPTGPHIIAFSVNPQVHACDDQSVMQNAATLGTIARNARNLYPDAWLEISPITLRPRFNPNAPPPNSITATPTCPRSWMPASVSPSPPPGPCWP
ncbi:MAG: hypothetical protein ACKOE2_12660, partial [Actinomycetales bacterium]